MLRSQFLIRGGILALSVALVAAFSAGAWAQGLGYAISPDQGLGPFNFTLPGYPTLEPPGAAIDNQSGTKYLNFGAPETVVGLVITPMTSSTVTGVRFTTADDAPGRDPLSYLLEGSNTGPNGTFIPISTGATGLLGVTARNTRGPAVTFLNALPYTNYRLTFPTIRQPIPNPVDNSMQIAEIELLNAAGVDVTPPGNGAVAIHLIPEPAGLAVLAVGGMVLLRRRK